MPGEAILTDNQLAGLVQSVGFSSTRKHRNYREDATAVAIILAESGGDANAHNPRPPDDSFGLFQINMYGDLKQERAERYGLRSTANLYQPRKNAEVAYDLFRRAGNTFRDWSTYNNLSYLRYMPRALQAVKEPDTNLPTIESQVGEITNPVGEVIDFFTGGENWLRVAYFVGGGVIIIVSVVLLGIESGAAGKVVRAVPVGRAATKAVRRVV